MLCRMSSEFLISTSPGVITVTCGLNLQPCWSTTPFTAFAPLALGAEATALTRPLLEPTTTFSIVVSCPHLSVSLLTLSFSTCGAPLYFTSTSTVPPPCAPARCGPVASITAPPTSVIAVSVTNVLRMDRPPAFLEFLLDGAAPRRAHDQPQYREREKSDSGRNEEPAIRLRLLQPQIDAVGRVAHEEVRALRPRRLLRRELQRDRVGERRLAVALRLVRIVPREMERDLLVVVGGPHAHEIDGRIEVARVDDDLALEQDVARRDLLPDVRARVVGDGITQRAHRHQRGRLRRVGPGRDGVAGQGPDVLGLLDGVEERGHRRAEHPVGHARRGL